MAIVGYNYGPVVSAALQLDRVKLLGDGISLVGSGKTITDHALSKALGADCKMLNVVTANPVCTTQSTTAKADTTITVSTEPAPEAVPPVATAAVDPEPELPVAAVPGPVAAQQ